MAAHWPRTPCTALWEIQSSLTLWRGQSSTLCSWALSTGTFCYERCQGKKGACFWESHNLNSAIGLWPWRSAQALSGKAHTVLFLLPQEAYCFMHGRAPTWESHPTAKPPEMSITVGRMGGQFHYGE